MYIALRLATRHVTRDTCPACDKNRRLESGDCPGSSGDTHQLICLQLHLEQTQHNTNVAKMKIQTFWNLKSDVFSIF